MFCGECGKPVPDNSKYCPYCSAAVTIAKPSDSIEKMPKNDVLSNEEQLMNEGRRVSSNIVYCADGKYRWIYELNLIRNPTVFLIVWKIFFFIILAGFVITMIADAIQWRDFFPDRILTDLKIFGIIFLVMTGLVMLGSLIYALIMGGKYCVMFEMDEEGINHKQMPKQAKKAQLIASLAAFGSAASGNIGAVGAGIAASRTQMYSQFDYVRRVKPYPKRNLIKLNGLLEHNQIYAEKEEFDFVLSFILRHTPEKAKPKKLQ